MWFVAALWGFAGCVNAAQPTHFGFKPIVINGSSEVFVTAINDRSMIAGTYTIGGQAYGFTSSGTNVATIPFPCSQGISGYNCVPVPSAVNSNGLVAGVAFTPNYSPYQPTTYFTWRPGESAPVPLIHSAPSGPMLLNNRNDVAVACYVYVYPYILTPCGVIAGPISDFGTVNGLSADATPESLNRAGDLAGVQTITFQGSPIQAGFTIRGGTIHNVVPPNAASVNYMVMNDQLQTAGSFIDTNGQWHGFTQRQGQTTVFDMPTSTVGITVTDENNSGRVVGNYYDANDAVHPFLYNGTVTTRIADRQFNYPPSLRINDEGTIILAELYSGTPPYSSISFRVLCGGPGC